ncbi:MAG TPA: SLC13 family permease [Polyangiaceae bacterium]
MLTKTVFIPAGLVAAAAVGIAANAAGLSRDASFTAAITALCAVWWVTEPIPIPVTSLLPFALLPLAGVLDHDAVAGAYGHTLILLLLGGFILSTALEKCGAHERLALGMVRLVGGHGGPRLVLGFMLAAATLSMWISNTATTLMMLPIATAVLQQTRDEKLAPPLLLGVAYASSIGGVGTPIGTPPNVIFMGVYSEATGNSWSFLRWMLIGVPTVVVLLPLAWWSLTRRLGASERLRLPVLGPMKAAERRVLAVFAVTVLLWIFRTEPFGGWTALFGAKGVGDSTIALGAIVAMFLVPDGEGDRLLDWKTANRIPWGLLLLFGGGIAIARAFEESGLSLALGTRLSAVSSLPLPLMVALVCLGVTFLTEVTSNTATATLLMPILAASAKAAGLRPELIMVPAALSASFAFMLPVATVPNAIVFGTDRVTTARMAREGFFINLMGVVVVTLVTSSVLR